MFSFDIVKRNPEASNISSANATSISAGDTITVTLTLKAGGNEPETIGTLTLSGVYNGPTVSSESTAAQG